VKTPTKTCGRGSVAQARPVRRLPPEVLGPVEVANLLRACEGTDHGAVRLRALVVVLYRSGMRISEALALRPRDMDLSAGWIRIMHGKGDRSRVVGMDPRACAVVGEWLRLRGTMDASVPVFCTHARKVMGTSYARRLLTELGRRAGIDRRVHAHGLRHTHAAELRGEGVDIGIISKQLGHRSIMTTIRYLDHIAPVAVVEAMRGRGW
jgi:site-specific recombinase XerD